MSVKWWLVVMGEPCQRGVAVSHDKAIKAAKEAFQARPDYGSIIAMNCVDVHVRLEPPLPKEAKIP